MFTVGKWKVQFSNNDSTRYNFKVTETQATIPNQMTTHTTTKTTEAADHSHFLIVWAVYISLLSLVFTVFFKTDFQRTKANAEESNMNGRKDNLGFEMDN